MKISVFIFAIIVGTSIAKPQFPYYSGEFALASSSEEGFDNSVSLSMEDSDEVALAGGKNWEKAALEHENSYRAQAGIDPYKLDAKMSKAAQQWAEKIAADCEMDHADQAVLKQGDASAESLFETGDVKADPTTLMKSGIDAWFGEWVDYDCAPVSYADVNAHGTPRNEYYKKVGHFMNTMSMKQTKVGYGYAVNAKCGKGFTVARYGGQNDAVFNAAVKNANGDIMKLNIAEMVPCVKAAK